MAKKLFIFCAALAFCVLLTNASIYRTIVVFDEDDVTNPRHGGSSQQSSQQGCQKEFHQAEYLQSCQKWIQQQMKQGGRGGRGGGGGGGGYDPSIIDDELDFDFENPHGPQERPELLQECCQELKQEDPVCVCPTLKQAATAVRSQGQGQHQRSEVKQLYRTARNLPHVCGIQKVGVCPFQASPFSPYY